MNLKKISLIIAVVIIFFGGLAAGFFFSKKSSSFVGKDCLEKYSYINHVIGCDGKYVIKKTGYADLKFEIENYIEKQKSEGKILEASVYFRDLIMGPWMGIDEDKFFTPASLLKVPIMLTVLRMADEDPSLLKTPITITRLPKDVELQYFRPAKEVKMGETYTVEELVESMIIYSDNHASGVLLDYLYNKTNDKQPLATTLRDTGTLRVDSDPYEYISVKSYASLFRLLYNSSYLSGEMSEKALKILSQAKFRDGLVAGVPENVKVGHKFGERSAEKNINQLHDCGIVYFPQNPYLVCVMTRGEKFYQLTETIKEISSMVYKEVESRKL